MSFPISGDNSFCLVLSARYLQDPDSVPSDWRLYFETQDIDKEQPATASSSTSSSGGAALHAAYRIFGYRQADLAPLVMMRPPNVPEIADPRHAVQALSELTVAGQAMSLSG